MHGVRLSGQGFALKEKILEAINDKDKKISAAEFYDRKEGFQEFFSSSYKLGIPKHRLPEDIVLTDSLSIDLAHCDKGSSIAKKGIKQNYVELPL